MKGLLITMPQPPDQASHRKLKEIQALASRFDSNLNGEFGQILRESGGVLLLGKNYAKAPRLLLGLNPGRISDTGMASGGSERGDSFHTECSSENPWHCLHKDYAYWKHCKIFLNAVQSLRDWCEDATVTFCFPWRTPGNVELFKLDRQMNGKLSAYSGMLLQKMLEHHRIDCDLNGLVLIVAGKASLRWIASASFLNFDWRQRTVGEAYGESTYQWRKVIFRDMTIYQVPHFSRANSNKRLEECARWLANELRLT